MDPDYYIYFLIVILFGLAVNGAINHRFKKSILTGVSVTSLSFVVPLFILLVGIYTTPVTTSVNALGVYRVLPTTVAPFNLHAPYFLYYLMLFGHYWSTMTYGPITILEYYGHILDAPSMLSPAQILTPPGPVTGIWFFSLFMIPVFAFGSLIFRNTRKLMVPVALTAIFILILSQYQYISPLLFIFDEIGSSPFIGAAFSTTFGLPAHALIVISASYIVMICVFLVNLQVTFSTSNIGREMSEIPRVFAIKRLRIKITISERTKHNLTKVAVILLIFAVLFSGWQAFDGEFYPSRAFPPSSGGNQVVEVAPYQPYQVPQSAFTVLHYLQAQETNPVQIVQIVAPYISNQTFLGFEGAINPHLRLNGNDLVGNYLNELISENLTSDIAPLLQANSIGYVVVEFYKITPSYVQQYFGFSNFGIVLQRLDCASGLSQVLSYPNISLYQVEGVKNLYYNSQLSLSIQNGYNFTPEIYNAFRLAGFNVSLTEDATYGSNFILNPGLQEVYKSSVSLLTPTQLYTFMNDTSSKTGNFRLTEGSGLPFKNIIIVNSGGISFSGGHSSLYIYLYLKGNGTINGLTVDTHSLWSMVPVQTNGTLSFIGNFNISFAISSKGQPLSGYSSNNVVYNVAAARGYELVDGNTTIPGGIPTFSGTDLFPNISGQRYHVTAPFGRYVEIYYYGIIAVLAVLGLCAAGYLDRKTKKDRKRPG